jgi:drug/metabolite transporter (DMT)-like permease
MDQQRELNLTVHKNIWTADLSRVMLVMFLWALCFPLISAGLSTAPPLYFAALRSLVAGTGLLVPAFALRRPVPQGLRMWFGLAGAGLGSVTLGFGGMFLAGGIVSPGLATVLANSQPLIAAGLAYFALGERLGQQRWTWLLIGFTGIVVVASTGFKGGDGDLSPAGVGYILLSAVGVAAGNVLLKRLAGQVDLWMATGWMFVLGGIPLLLAALALEPLAQVEWSLRFVTFLLTLGLLGTALAFLLWFSLLHRDELNRLNAFTFLTPIFALIIGAFFFDEHLRWVEISGIALTLLGVLGVNRS